MIYIQMVLMVGSMKHGVFESYDEYDIEDDEDVNSILNVVSDPVHDRAILSLHVTGWLDKGRTIASFKKIKMKDKAGGSKYRWIVVEE